MKNAGCVLLVLLVAGPARADVRYVQPPCEIIVAGDINGDCAVNFLDFRLMALQWLTNGNF